MFSSLLLRPRQYLRHLRRPQPMGGVEPGAQERPAIIPEGVGHVVAGGVGELVRGVGRNTYVSSPSFTLINEYQGRIPFYHIDLFRLESKKEAEGLGLEEYVCGKGITAIEWADKISSLLPEEVLWVKIHYTGEHTRTIEIVPKGKRYEQLMRKMSGFGVRNSALKG